MTTRKLFPLVFVAMAAAALLPERTFAQPPPPGPGGGWCVDCSLCWKNNRMGNKAPEGDDTSINLPMWGAHSWCVDSGGCASQHPFSVTCLMEPPQQAALNAVLVDIVAAVRGDDTLALSRALANDGPFRDRFVFVPNRRAIQALGCNDSVIAHIPLLEDSDAFAWVTNGSGLATVVAADPL